MTGQNLLVTAKPGTGKTTLVERLVREFPNDAGGFLTREIRERGVRKGFRIVTLAGQTAVLAHVDFASPVRVGKYGTDLAALESVAVPAVRRALQQKKIVAIDEIGRMEIASEAFRKCVLEVLSSDCILLAAIQQYAHPFTDAIKRRTDVRLFPLTTENRDTVREEIAAILEQALRKS